MTTARKVELVQLSSVLVLPLPAIAADTFHPVVGWHCQICPYQPRCWAWG